MRTANIHHRHLRTTLRVLSGAVLVWGLTICSAHSGIISPEPLSAAEYMGSNGISSPGTFNYTVLGGDGTVVDTVQIVMSGVNNMVSASQTTIAGVEGAQAEINYQFEILGPADPSVPILISFSMQATGTGGNYASYAELITGNLLLDTYLCSASATATNKCGPATTNNFFGTSYATTLSTDVPTDVSNSLDIVAGSDSGPGSTAFASLDPYIEIDPSFADAGDYTVVFSEGVSNGSPLNAVPEPGSLALLLSALCGFGVIRRRERALGRQS
jgi:hypothetical protein